MRFLPAVLVFAAHNLQAQTITTMSGIEHLTASKPDGQHSTKCADRGKAKNPKTLDSLTNFLKNRIDSASTYHLTTIPTLLKLPFSSTGPDKSDDMPRSRNDWKDPDKKRTAKYESRPIAVEGYIIAVDREAKETTNCGIPDSSWFDYHMWVVKTEKEAHDRDKRKAIVAEITPRVRHGHAADFDIAQMRKWAHGGVKVRVSGWLMLDPEHPDDSRPNSKGDPASRGTIWEIHPVMRIEKVK
jgi:hypothetical protein